MGFSLKEVVPWGRSFNEYVAMFALEKSDLSKRFLGCGDGPASFNAALTAFGGSVISVDPIYHFNAEQIAERIGETYDLVMEQTRRNAHEFVWKNIKTVEHLGEVRSKAMSDFLEDFPGGRREGRYVHGQLPQLPFSDGTFDVALCSHFLFLYSEHLDAEFHLQSLRELCRVAREVRVFPILELGSQRSRHVDQVVSTLIGEGYLAEIETVSYEFQRGGNQMLKVRKQLP